MSDRTFSMGKRLLVAFMAAVCLGAAASGVCMAAPGEMALPENADVSEPDTITAAQADEMALALTNKIWVWDWVAFFVPYMSQEGVEKILPAAQSAEWAGQTDWTTGTLLAFTREQVDGAREKDPEKAQLTKADIDAHAKMIMESNGWWDCIDGMLPYMTEGGIRQVKQIYAEKHGG